MHRKNSRSISAIRTACEPLENRLMFITTTFDATSGSDVISLSVVSGDIVCTINGVQDSRSDVLFNSIEINGFGGNDTINIHSTGNNTVTVNAGAGDDSIRITPSSHDLD